ncbi:hypothetical protein D6825_01675 [Candidatus Woesearchaeota archaeon]|nr:MAG: hypothetical protein D6825_01675 [Candidatus Woesearchaeota archaeon]
MTTLAIELLGWIGAVMILTAYALITYGTLSRKSKKYHALNLLGASMLGTNALYNKALPLAALNAVWLCIALYGLVRAVRGRSK